MNGFFKKIFIYTLVSFTLLETATYSDPYRQKLSELIGDWSLSPEQIYQEIDTLCDHIVRDQEFISDSKRALAFLEHFFSWYFFDQNTQKKSEVCKRFAQAGVTIDTPLSYKNRKTGQLTPPLTFFFYAVGRALENDYDYLWLGIYHKVEAVKALLYAGAQTNWAEETEGNTALHILAGLPTNNPSFKEILTRPEKLPLDLHISKIRHPELHVFVRLVRRPPVQLEQEFLTASPIGEQALGDARFLEAIVHRDRDVFNANGHGPLWDEAAGYHARPSISFRSVRR